MRATDLLREQHREIEGMLDDLERKAGARQREELVRELATIVGAHMLIEQTLFYPITAEVLNDRDLVRGSYEEHELAAFELRRLLTTAGNDPGFLPRVRVLKELLLPHIREEEQELFRHVQPTAGDTWLEDVGNEMETRFDMAVEAGYETTIPEGAIEADNPDVAFALLPKTQFRNIPKKIDTRRVVRRATGPTRKVAAKEGVVKMEPTGSRRRAKGAGPHARKSREGFSAARTAMAKERR